MEKISQYLDDQGRVKIWPSKQAKKKAVLRYLSSKFDFDKDYSEKKVNELIVQWHTFGDYFLLRRGLIELRLLQRTKNGAEYWRIKEGFESPAIKRLHKSLEDDKDKAVDEFWKMAEKHKGHFIDPIEYDENYCILTMVFRGDDSVKTVSIFGELFGQDTEENLFSQIEGTDVFYKSYVVARNTRSLYVYLVNEDPEAEWEDVDVRLDPLMDHTVTCTDDELFPEEFAVLFKQESMLELPEFKLPSEATRSTHSFSVKEKALSHPLLQGDRRMWYCEPLAGPSDKLLVFLDGYEYFYETKALNIIDSLVKNNEIPSVNVLFIDNRKDRMTNLIFDKDFMAAVTDELAKYDPAHVVLVGFSLGGLMASFMALENPETFKYVLAQSSAYYWEPGENVDKQSQLVKRFRNEPLEGVDFHISIGRLESKIADHHQANLEMVQVLKNKDIPVCFEEHVGGHTFFDAALSLGNGLKYLLK
ncbi:MULTISPECIES: DUF2087 domain-containing protein [unclassified Fusibacter]|uniref:DUF2087 domain-containing protein n=1 Tax=unclassified Fusibacter TaxID=2624464 RepID=UPI001011C92D|nr:MULTISPECIES: DUF2087 domain-containing protein [unclassified Fusibacter]MCK8060162.1 DUF2087 domain-containing protein [Fusibacter sp. A2]NPE22302.1 DUF2087 domain-containing protein [Fusibacter sp. A1]RXV61075.1 DUF2087 domain-containing protein [Fusibacter sp. A1]